MQKIAPFIWFKDKNAEEAVNLYLSVFPSGRILGTQRAGGAGPFEQGEVILITFEIEGQEITAFNGGPASHVEFNEAFSFFVRCEDQQEIDRYWDGLIADGGKPIQCGWLIDKFGFRWQIVPRRIGELIKHNAAFQAMMGMVKLDIAELEKAAATSKPS